MSQFHWYLCSGTYFNFPGHTDEIVSFDWRIHTSPSKAYQLVSLARDQHLKMFAISKNLIKVFDLFM